MPTTSVMHIINSLELGGAERFLADFLAHVDRKRFTQTVVCLYRGGPFAKPIEAAGISVRVLGIDHHVRPKGWAQVLRALKEGPTPDIVHTHLPESCWYGLPSAWLRAVPIRVAHLQNVQFHFPLKLRLLDRFASVFADAAIACSKAVSDFYQQHLHYPRRKLHVVYNSVDFARFDHLPPRDAIRTSLGLSADSLVLVSVASLTTKKGHHVLLEAMPHVVTKFPTCTLLLVGEGGLRPGLEDQARRLGLEASVRFLGHRLDVPHILAGADVFVLPSLWEGLPLVLTEAGAAGLSAVGTNVDGIGEVLVDGETGLLVPPNQPMPLAEAICALLADDRRRGDMGAQARQRVQQVFSMQRAAADIERIYDSLLKRKGMAPAAR